MLKKGYSTSNELINYAQELKVKLDGIIYKNELYQVPKGYTNFIINLDETGNGGSHWCALFVPKNHKYAYWFDSFGIYPPEAVKDYIKKSGKDDVIFNNKQVQTLRSNFCGQYSLLFLKYMQKEKGSYSKRYEKFLKLFQNNNKNNY